jgi:antitoxin FitA
MHMSKMIQIRHVPDALHRRVKARAAQRGTSLSEYLLRVIQRDVETLTEEEFLEMVRKRDPVENFSAAEIIRQERDSR